MPSPIPKLVLLPGLDGTGDLFRWFIHALPPEFDATPVRFPADVCLSYGELGKIVESALPASEPFVLVAESFSTPLAIHFAAANPSNLMGLILCAGFATSPLRGWRNRIALGFADVAFKIPISQFVLKAWLVGRDAPPELVRTVLHSVSKVYSQVLSGRLQSVLACDVRADLGRVVAPLLYLRAAADPLIPERCLDEILKIKPDTNVVSIPGPHLLLQREPNRAAESVALFVRQLDR